MFKPYYIVIGEGEAARSAMLTWVNLGIPKEQILWCPNKKNPGGYYQIELFLTLLLKEHRRVRAHNIRVPTNVSAFSFRKKILERAKQFVQERLAKYEAIQGVVTPKVGEAKVDSVKSCVILSSDEGKTAIPFRSVVIAPGSRPVIPDLFSPYKKSLWTAQLALQHLISEEMTLPSSIIIVGNDQGAVQWAQVFIRFGVEVTLVMTEKCFQTCGQVESDIIKRVLLNENVRLIEESRIEKVSYSDEKFTLVGRGNKIEAVGQSNRRQQNIQFMLEAPRLFLSTDYRPELKELFIDNDPAWRKIESQHSIYVDSFLRFKDSTNIFMAGSAFDFMENKYLPFPVKNVLARRSGQVAAINASCELKNMRIFNAQFVPLTNHIDPELASVGLLEEEAYELEGSIEVYNMPITETTVPVASVNTYNRWKFYRELFVKIIVSKEMHTGKACYRLIGAQMMAPNAAYAIQIIAPFIADGKSVLDFFKHIMICPTIPEALKLCLKACPEVSKYHFNNSNFQANFPKMSKQSQLEKPIVVIGGGLSGCSAALELASKGKRVFLVEQKERIGGAGDETYASKLGLFNARRDHANHKGFRSSASYHDCTASDEEEKKRHKALWRATSEQLQGLLQSQSVKNRDELRSAGIEVVSGEAKFSSETTISIDHDGLKTEVEFSKAIIAIGGEANIPPLYHFDSPEAKLRCWTSSDALRKGELPESVIVIGGGVIGIEFALAWRALGVRVILISRDKLLNFAEPEASQAVEEILVYAGVIVVTQANVTEPFYDNTNERFYCKGVGKISFFDMAEKPMFVKKDCNLSEIISEGTTHILLACGRSANVTELFDEKSPLSQQIVDDGGKIIVNEFMQTPSQHIFAAGCCTDSKAPDLVPTAAVAGMIAANNMLDQGAYEIPDIWPVPAAVFIYPEYAAVGYSVLEVESEIKKGSFGDAARVEHHTFIISKDLLPMMYIDALETYDGCFLKLVTVDDVLVGASMVSPRASLTIQFATYFIRNKKSILDLYQAQYVRPSITEAYLKCAEQFSSVRKALGFQLLDQRMTETLASGTVRNEHPMNFSPGFFKQPPDKTNGELNKVAYKTSFGK